MQQMRLKSTKLLKTCAHDFRNKTIGSDHAKALMTQCIKNRYKVDNILLIVKKSKVTQNCRRTWGC